MDGDEAPLQEIAHLCKHTMHTCWLMKLMPPVCLVPKAGTGLQIWIATGRIRLHLYIWQSIRLAWCSITGSNTLRNYLVNFARSFIYTNRPATAPLPAGTGSISIIALRRSGKTI
jgi:hypothetical protein